MRHKVKNIVLNERASLVVALLWIAAVVYLDHVAHRVGVDISTLLLAPVALVAWFSSRRVAFLVAGLAVLAIVVPDAIIEHLEPAGVVLELVIFSGAFFSAALVVNLLSSAYGWERRRARHDPLTGTLNSERFHEALSAELTRAKRYAHPLTLAFVDLDNFKRVNDEHGHLVGDEVLRSVAGLMGLGLRGSDVVGRLGGDEFGILLPETASEPAQVILERLRDAISRLAEDNGWPLSASIGATSLSCGSCDVDTSVVIQHADAIMYKAKRAGKDRVIVEEFVAAAESTSSATHSRASEAEAADA